MTTFVPSPRRTRSQVASLKSANPSNTMNTIIPTPATSSSIPRLKSSASLRIPKPTPTTSTTTSILPTEKITPSASITNGKLLRKSSVRSIRAAPRPVSSVGDVNPPSRLGRTMSRIRRDVDPSPQTITTSLKTSDRTPGFKEEKSINRDERVKDPGKTEEKRVARGQATNEEKEEIDKSLQRIPSSLKISSKPSQTSLRSPSKQALSTARTVSSSSLLTSTSTLRNIHVPAPSPSPTPSIGTPSRITPCPPRRTFVRPKLPTKGKGSPFKPLKPNIVDDKSQSTSLAESPVSPVSRVKVGRKISSESKRNSSSAEGTNGISRTITGTPIFPRSDNMTNTCIRIVNRDIPLSLRPGHIDTPLVSRTPTPNTIIDHCIQPGLSTTLRDTDMFDTPGRLSDLFSPCKTSPAPPLPFPSTTSSFQPVLPSILLETDYNGDASQSIDSLLSIPQPQSLSTSGTALESKTNVSGSSDIPKHYFAAVENIGQDLPLIDKMDHVEQSLHLRNQVKALLEERAVLKSDLQSLQVTLRDKIQTSSLLSEELHRERASWEGLLSGERETWEGRLTRERETFRQTLENERRSWEEKLEREKNTWEQTLDEEMKVWKGNLDKEKEKLEMVRLEKEKWEEGNGMREEMEKENKMLKMRLVKFQIDSVVKSIYEEIQDNCRYREVLDVVRSLM